MTKTKLTSRQLQAQMSREKILQGTMGVLASKGIKGTTHRAVAAHADIQLSLITYYFKDIKELIREAFLLRTKQAIVNVNTVWQLAFEKTTRYSKAELRKKTVRQALCDELSQLACNYLHQQVINSPVGLAVEQVLFTEAQFSPELKDIADAHKQALLEPIIKFCTLFNKNQPNIDAQILLTMFTQIEYQQLSMLEPDESVSLSLIRRSLGNAMGLQFY